jgi:hypothetical protein
MERLHTRVLLMQAWERVGDGHSGGTQVRQWHGARKVCAVYEGDKVWAFPEGAGQDVRLQGGQGTLRSR